MSRVIIGDKELQSVKWRDEYVMTTETMAYFFVVSTDSLKMNFGRNRSRFVEGKHFFSVSGKDLESLRVTNCYLQVSPMTRVLYLWTRRGVARHAKMINSDVAWDIFEMLEDAYFNRDANPIGYNDTTPGADFWWEVKQPRRPSDFRRGIELKKLASHTHNPELRERLILEAAILIAGKPAHTK